MKLKAILEESGVFEYGLADARQVEFSQEVRKMCQMNTCRQYGKTWACPPAVGTVEECRERVQKFETLLVFSVKCQLEDSFDYEGMTRGMSRFKEVSRALDQALRPHLSDYLMLGNEGCDLCKECTYPDAPCRFPQRAHGSLEGYGIWVSKLAEQAGIHYINGKNTVTYFGAVACHPQELEG